MSQSLTKLYAHLIFSTKNRERSFQDEYRAMLRKYDITFDEQYVWD